MDHRIKLIALLTLGLLVLLAACSNDSPPEDTPPVTATQPETQTDTESTSGTPDASASAQDDPSEPEPTTDPGTSAAVEASPESPGSTEPAADTPEAPSVGVTDPIVSEPIPGRAFADASLALEELDSYRFSTSFVFVGEGDGETETGSVERIGVIASLERKHFLWRDIAENKTFEIVQIEERAWTFQEGQWEEVPVFLAEAMGQAALVYAPSLTWSGLFGAVEPEATYVGAEIVNGVEADHYTATFQQWGAYWEGDLVDAAGDVWIAKAGYPVRYHFSATGIDEMGNRGTVTWAMNLSDVNQPIEIEPPTSEGDDVSR